MKYKIIIEDTIAQEFSIEAKNIEDAQNKAIEEYENGNLVLSHGELQEKK